MFGISEVTWVFPKIGVPQNGWFISWKILLKWMIWVVFSPYFWVQHPHAEIHKPMRLFLQLSAGQKTPASPKSMSTSLPDRGFWPNFFCTSKSVGLWENFGYTHYIYIYTIRKKWKEKHLMFIFTYMNG